MSPANPLGNDGPNADQIAYWNEVSGAKWVELESQIDQSISPPGLFGMDAAAIVPGERVLDVGCGCGQTSVQLAGRVGPDGSVLGVDISAPMLSRARDRGREAGATNLVFEIADAQTHPFEAPRFDLVFSRFGVMFFANPKLAFANLASAMSPDGRLTFVCWQEFPKNPWMAVPVAAAAQHVELPPPPTPGAPGPFSFADPDRVTDILDSAGFREIYCEPLEGQIGLAGSVSLDDATDFVTQMGPAGSVLRNATPEIRASARKSVREALVPYQTQEGVRLDYAAWIVTARRSRIAI